MGAHLVLDWGVPAIGWVVLWMQFGIGCEVFPAK